VRTANHSTDGSFASLSPDGTKLMFVYYTDAPLERARVAASLTSYRPLSTSLLYVDDDFGVLSGAGASRSFELFAIVDASPSTGQVRLRLLDATLTVVATRVFSGVSKPARYYDHWLPSFSDDDAYVSMSFHEHAEPESLTTHVMDTKDLADVVLDGWALEKGITDLTDGYFFSRACDGVSVDYLARNLVIGMASGHYRSYLYVDRLHRGATPRLDYVNVRELPMYVLSASVVPYEVPRQLNVSCAPTRLLVTTGQADSPGTSLRGALGLVPALGALDSNEVRLYSFDGSNVTLASVMDTGCDVYAGALSPLDSGDTLLITTAPQASRYSYVVGVNGTTRGLASLGMVLRRLTVSGGTMSDLDPVLPIGDRARCISYSAQGHHVVTASSSEEGAWNNVGVWHVQDP
jgi:hypothetical protein